MPVIPGISISRKTRSGLCCSIKALPSVGEFEVATTSTSSLHFFFSNMLRTLTAEFSSSIIIALIMNKRVWLVLLMNKEQKWQLLCLLLCHYHASLRLLFVYQSHILLIKD